MNIIKKLFNKSRLRPSPDWDWSFMTDKEFDFINNNGPIRFSYIDKNLCKEVLKYYSGKEGADETPVKGFYLGVKSLQVRAVKLVDKKDIEQPKIRLAFRVDYGHGEQLDRTRSFSFEEYPTASIEFLREIFCIPEEKVPNAVKEGRTSWFFYKNHPEFF